MAKFSFKNAEMQSTVVVLRDGRAMEVRRGELTGAAIPDRVYWASLAAWRAWLPEGAQVEGLEAVEPPAPAAAGGGGAPAVPAALLEAAAAARQDAAAKAAALKEARTNAAQRQVAIEGQIRAMREQIRALQMEEEAVKLEVRAANAEAGRARYAALAAENRVSYARAAAGRAPEEIRAEAEALNAAVPNLRKRDMARYSTFALRNALLLAYGLPLDSDRYMDWDRSIFLNHIGHANGVHWRRWRGEEEEEPVAVAPAHPLAAAAAERGIPVWVAEAWAEAEAEDAAAEEEEARPAVVEEAIAAALRYEREVLG
jgi:hypothetical protein